MTSDVSMCRNTSFQNVDNLRTASSERRRRAKKKKKKREKYHRKKRKLYRYDDVYEPYCTA